jgi:hypothetical protein
MILDVHFSDEITTILQSSKHYQDPLKLTIDQIYDISTFVYLYEKEEHVQFIKNYENILFGFCYGTQYGSTFWMFLDENYIFYDVKLPNNLELSKKTREELGDICPTVKKLRLQYFDFSEKPNIKSWTNIFNYFIS